MCQTCDMIRGLLMAQNVPAGVVDSVIPIVASTEALVVGKAKRKVSAYQRRYKAAFKRISSRYRTKAGKWKKGGFKSAVRAAHKEARK